MHRYFPRHIIEKYSDHSHNDIYSCYQNAAEDMIKSEPLMFIWGNKTVHRNSMVDETTVHYMGQIGRKTKDGLFTDLIDEKIRGVFFLKSSAGHVCYEVVSCTLLSSRGDKHTPPKYELKIKKMSPTSIVQTQYPEYFDNIHLHPTACVKLQSMADYGFIPMDFHRDLTHGIHKGFTLVTPPAKRKNLSS